MICVQRSAFSLNYIRIPKLVYARSIQQQSHFYAIDRKWYKRSGMNKNPVTDQLCHMHNSNSKKPKKKNVCSDCNGVFILVCDDHEHDWSCYIASQLKRWCNPINAKRSAIQQLATANQTQKCIQHLSRHISFFFSSFDHFELYISSIMRFYCCFGIQYWYIAFDHVACICPKCKWN